MFFFFFLVGKKKKNKYGEKLDDYFYSTTLSLKKNYKYLNVHLDLGDIYDYLCGTNSYPSLANHSLAKASSTPLSITLFHVFTFSNPLIPN